MWLKRFNYKSIWGAYSAVELILYIENVRIKPKQIYSYEIMIKDKRYCQRYREIVFICMSKYCNYLSLPSECDHFQRLYYTSC